MKLHSTTSSSNSSTSKIGSSTWEKFFESCGDIPSEMKKKYASSFVKQRIHPHLLRDLGKDDLKELGINALGDQLAIIRYINSYDGNPPEFAPPPQPKKAAAAPAPPPSRTVHRNESYIDDDDVLMLEEEDVITPPKQQQYLSTAPDRHDVYHIKMPTGNNIKSERARNILDVHNTLKEQGVIKRGETAIRRSGMKLNSVSNNSKQIQKQQTLLSPVKGRQTAALIVQDTDITSSSPSAGWLSTRSLRSDAISTKTIVVKDAASIQNLMIGRSMIANRSSSTINGNKIPVRVNLGGNDDINAALSAPLMRNNNPIKRQTVRYDDEEDDELFNIGANEEFMERHFNVVPTVPRQNIVKIQRRLPIHERLQLVHKQGEQQQRNRRPIITLAGNKINLTGSGGGRGRGGNINKGGGGKKNVSILQRISF